MASPSLINCDLWNTSNHLPLKGSRSNISSLNTNKRRIENKRNRNNVAKLSTRRKCIANSMKSDTFIYTSRQLISSISLCILLLFFIFHFFVHWDNSFNCFVVFHAPCMCMLILISFSCCLAPSHTIINLKKIHS